MNPYNRQWPAEGDPIYVDNHHFTGMTRVVAARFRGVSTPEGFFYYDDVRVLHSPVLPSHRRNAESKPSVV